MLEHRCAYSNRVQFEFVLFSVYNGEFLHCFSKGKKGRRKKKEGKKKEGKKNEKDLEEERSEVMLRKRERKERQVE